MSCQSVKYSGFIKWNFVFGIVSFMGLAFITLFLLICFCVLHGCGLWWLHDGSWPLTLPFHDNDINHHFRLQKNAIIFIWVIAYENSNLPLQLYRWFHHITAHMALWQTAESRLELSGRKKMLCSWKFLSVKYFIFNDDMIFLHHDQTTVQLET